MNKSNKKTYDEAMDDSNNVGRKAGLGMLRIDLQDSLRQSSVDPRALSSFERILLTTDGTVTDILEAQFWEAIRIVKIYQDFIESESAIPYLDIRSHTKVLVRKVILRGKCSHKNYIYAESIIVPDRLDERIKEQLLSTEKPLGQLMLEIRMETFREILTCRLEPADELGQYFDVSSDSNLISRTYRVFCNKQPIILITEKFAEMAFKD